VQASISFFCRLDIKDNQPAWLTDEVIMKDRHWKRRISNKGIENPIGLCSRQVARREGLQKKAAWLLDPPGMLVHMIN
jgi:hypothetical protein